MRLSPATIAGAKRAALATKEAGWFRFTTKETDNGLGTVREPVRAEAFRGANCRTLKAEEIPAGASVKDRRLYLFSWVGSTPLGTGDLVGKSEADLYEVVGILTPPVGGQTTGTAHVARRKA